MRASALAVAVLSVAAVGCGGDKSGGSSSPAYSCDKVQPAGFPTTSEGIMAGDTLNDLSFVDKNGNVRCTRDFTGHPVMISIGAGWCGPCKIEMPHILTVYDEFKGDGFEVIDVMLDDWNGGNPDEVFMQEWQDQFDIPNSIVLVPDFAEDFWSFVPPPANAIPHNILLNKDGVVSYTESGAFTNAGPLRTRVSALVAETPVLVYE